MASPSDLLQRNFDIPCALLNHVGGNALDRRHPNWRSFYTIAVILLATVEIGYLFRAERSNLVQFLVVFQNAVVVGQAVAMIFVGIRRSHEFRVLRARLGEIQALIGENGNNGLIMCEALKLSYRLQRCISAIYAVTVMVIVVGPILLWLTLHEKVLIMVYFVPGVHGGTDEGFLLNVLLHAVMLPAAFCIYVSLECIFLAVIVPVGAYVNAFGNETRRLNSMLERHDPDVRDQLIRIVKLHQLLVEYEAMLENLYNSAVLVKIALVYLGIVSAIVVIFKTNDRIAYIYLVLQFEHLTRYCLMGTIITVKNDQLLSHINNINWFLLEDQVSHLVLMLRQAQNATGVTIGKFKPLNAESYAILLRSIYSYVMVLVTVMD